MKIDTRSASYGVVVLTATNIVSQVIGFVYRVFLARLVGAEGIGLFSLVMPAYSVIYSVIISGLTVAVSRLSAGYEAVGNTRAARQLVSRSIYLFFILWSAAAALILPLSDGISVYLLGDARTRTALVLLLPCLLLTGLENIHKNHFYGLKKVHPPALSETVEVTVRTGTVLLLLYVLKPDYEEYAVALIVAGMIACEVVSSALLRHIYKREQRGVSPSGPGLPGRTMLADISRIAIPIGLANLLSNLIGSVNSVMIPARLMASGLTAAESLSAYGVVVGMTMPLLNLPTAFMVGLTLVMVPRLSEDLALGRYASMRRRVLRTVRTTGLCIIPAMGLLALFGADLARLLFQQETAGAYMLPLAVGTVFGCYQGILGGLLSGMGMQRRTAINMVASGLVQLVLTWALAARPPLRVGGFVWAYIIASALGAALCALDVRRFFRKGNVGVPPLRSLQ